LGNATDAGLARSNRTAEPVQKTAVEPEGKILIPVLIALIASLACAGMRGVNFLSAILLRPAMGFCEDFCIVSAGASVPFSLREFWLHPTLSVALAVFVFACAAGVGYLFHVSIHLSHLLSDERLPRFRENLVRGLSAVALFALVVALLSSPESPAGKGKDAPSETHPPA
jgi:hypothetical protein